MTVAFWHRAAKEPATPDPHDAARGWWQALEPLGPFRQQVIACLRGDIRNGKARFSVEDGQDLFDAFRRFIVDEENSASSALDSIGRSILAAGRLLTGDLAGAERIVDLLPETPHVTDHGAGKCLLMPARVLKNVLPLPDNTDDPDRWTARSAEQAALRAWLAQHREHLVWMEVKGEYCLGA